MDAGEEKVSSNNSVTLTGNCTAVVKPEDRGFHVAILLSVTSCIVILVMSLSFIMCYLRERSQRRESASSSFPRKRKKPRCRRRSGCWLEKSLDAPARIYHLPQHLEPYLSCNTHLYMPIYHGCQRSQKSLINDPLLEPYHTETPLFPLQRVSTLPAPGLPACSNTPVDADRQTAYLLDLPHTFSATSQPLLLH